VGPRVDLGALEQLKLLSLPRTEQRFVGHPSCRDKYRTREEQNYEQKGNVALRRVNGAAVTIGTVKSVAVAAEYYCH
jgi:hypothetical protein